MIPGYDSTNYLGIGGWTYHSPLYDALLDRWDCYDFYQAAEENQNLFYLVSSDRVNKVTERINNYYTSAGIPIRVIESDRFTTARDEVIVLQFCVPG